jgi:hypothetical protein
MRASHRARATSAYIAFALTAAAFGAAALVSAIAEGPGGGGDCDNMAGECLHMRQGAAILVIRAACVAAGVIPLVAAGYVWRGARTSRLLVFVTLACAAVAMCCLAVDPVNHLSNRWDGWLGGNP